VSISRCLARINSRSSATVPLTCSLNIDSFTRDGINRLATSEVVAEMNPAGCRKWVEARPVFDNHNAISGCCSGGKSHDRVVVGIPDSTKAIHHASNRSESLLTRCCDAGRLDRQQPFHQDLLDRPRPFTTGPGRHRGCLPGELHWWPIASVDQPQESIARVSDQY